MRRGTRKSKKWNEPAPLKLSANKSLSEHIADAEDALMRAASPAMGMTEKDVVPGDIRKFLLETAINEVIGHDKDYGVPNQTFFFISQHWNAWLESRGFPVILSPHDVSVMQTLAVIPRLARSPDHFDSWADIAGYAACGAEVTRAVKK